MVSEPGGLGPLQMVSEPGGLGPLQMVSESGGLGSLQMVSKPRGLGLIQMVSEPDTERYASKKAEPQRGVDTRQCANKDVGPEMGRLGGPTSIRERE